ncbi:MAG TPA: hypothetical protein ENK05_05825 [Gammaproteobacteria bacterium]|nr:hypothetical protein [Gammaproteobacteria bacterium]
MTLQRHVLEVYEPYEYTGPNPFLADGIAVLHGPARESFYLLHLDEPLEFEQQAIEQLLVLPRYSGDKIDRAVSSTCTVNIARVPPGHSLQDGRRLSYDDFLRWGVGKITLHEQH